MKTWGVGMCWIVLQFALCLTCVVSMSKFIPSCVLDVTCLRLLIRLNGLFVGSGDFVGGYDWSFDRPRD